MMIARILAFAILGIFAAGAAKAEIGLTPLRQVVTEDAPVAAYRVSNPSRRIVEGRVSWADLTATETGYVAASPAARAAMSAAPYLQVSPAFFRLEPGASVTITVALRGGAKFEKGEKRSHLLIETAAARTPIRKASGSLEADIGLGVSTPVLVRFGDGRAAAKIGHTRLLRTPEGLLELVTSLQSEGDFSAYGRIDVYMTANGDTLPKLIKRIDNVAAYIDAPSRRVSAPLGVEQLPAGKLEIRFVGGAEFDGVTFARRAFEIAPPG